MNDDKKIFKIGLDIHGVLDSIDSFKAIQTAVNLFFINHKKKTGESYDIEYHVISGAPVIDQLIELYHKYNYNLSAFKKFHSIIEYYYSNRNDYIEDSNFIIYKNDKDQWMMTHKYWWNGKNLICKKEGIDLLIDDMEEYSKEYLLERMFIFDKNNWFNLTKDLHELIKRILEKKKLAIIYEKLVKEKIVLKM